LRYIGNATSSATGDWTLAPGGYNAGDYVCAIATDVTGDSSAFSFNVLVLGPSTATPTETATITRTNTPTTTPSSTPTFTITDTPIGTYTVTPTITPTGTITPTRTETLVLSPTPTSTMSPTITLTATHTPVLTTIASIDLSGKVAIPYPNPATNEMRFAVPSNVKVRIVIYQLTGERIADLDETDTSYGESVLLWNCQDVAPGIYLAKIVVNGELKETIKIAIVK